MPCLLHSRENQYVQAILGFYALAFRDADILRQDKQSHCTQYMQIFFVKESLSKKARPFILC